MKRVAMLFGIVALVGCRGEKAGRTDEEPVPPPTEWSADMQTERLAYMGLA